ncbi:10918_t:CDS:1 [Scutellospora calospora]|uniref:10918_t:CDS:1 n=1 Tax=Scutellospora calospora TaxID=85575 RepID=A0ACA9LUZ9_9GLOM|nr:10918_t:CDS:1 [Scutellospora calospora]
MSNNHQKITKVNIQQGVTMKIKDKEVIYTYAQNVSYEVKEKKKPQIKKKKKSLDISDNLPEQFYIDIFTEFPDED